MRNDILEWKGRIVSSHYSAITRKCCFSVEFFKKDIVFGSRIHECSTPLYISFFVDEKEFTVVCRNEKTKLLDAHKYFRPIGFDGAPFFLEPHFDKNGKLRVACKPVAGVDVMFARREGKYISIGFAVDRGAYAALPSVYHVNGVDLFPIAVPQGHSDARDGAVQRIEFDCSAWLPTHESRIYVGFCWEKLLFFTNSPCSQRPRAFAVRSAALHFLCLQNRSGLSIKALGESWLSRMGGKAAFACVRFAVDIIKKFWRPSIWLIGEDSGMRAQDNGFVLFEWIKRNKRFEKIYYVISRYSNDLESLRPYKNAVVCKDSLWHWILYCFAKKVVGTHSLRDTMPSVLETSIASNAKRVCILQHGVTGIKRIGYSPGSYNNKLKSFHGSSVKEWKLIAGSSEAWMRRPHIFKLTGLPRYDRLISCEAGGQKHLLIMPTWREWLQGAGNSGQPPFFWRQYEQLLLDARFHELLRRFDLFATVLLHPYLGGVESQVRLPSFAGERIAFVAHGPGVCVQTYILGASLLITDYSSVAFDCNYMKRNVIFFFPDFNDFLDIRGSYINLECQLFGQVAYSPGQVIASLERIAAGGFAYPSHSAAHHKYLYAFHDQNNCKRNYNAIKNK